MSLSDKAPTSLNTLAATNAKSRKKHRHRTIQGSPKRLSTDKKFGVTCSYRV